MRILKNLPPGSPGCRSRLILDPVEEPGAHWRISQRADVHIFFGVPLMIVERFIEAPNNSQPLAI